MNSNKPDSEKTISELSKELGPVMTFICWGIVLFLFFAMVKCMVSPFMDPDSLVNNPGVLGQQLSR